MNEPDNVLTFCVTAMLAWGAWHYGWKQLALDELRQVLFTIRDQLFIDAASARYGFTFDSVVYREARDYINQLIRFCHRITIPSLLLVMLSPCRRHALNYEPRWHKTLEALPEGEAKSRLREVRKRTALECGKFLLKTSPSFLLFSCAFVLALIVLSVIHHGVRAVRSVVYERWIESMEAPMRSLDSQAAALA